MSNVRLDDFSHGIGDFQNRKGSQKSHGVSLSRELAPFQLIHHSWAGDEFVVRWHRIPPLPSPISASHHRRFRTNLEVETGDGGFDVVGCHGESIRLRNGGVPIHSRGSGRAARGRPETLSLQTSST